MKEAITYIVNSSTVAIVKGPYEADDHGIEHHTVSPITFKGEFSPSEDSIPLAQAPEDVRSRITDAYGVLIDNNRFSSRVIEKTASISDKPALDI